MISQKIFFVTPLPGNEVVHVALAFIDVKQRRAHKMIRMNVGDRLAKLLLSDLDAVLGPCVNTRNCRCYSCFW